MNNQNSKFPPWRVCAPRWLLLLALVCIMTSSWLALAKPTYATRYCANPYVVQPGDHLFQIARRFNTTIWALLDYNPWLVYHPDLIYAGSVLCLPPGAGGGGSAPINRLDVVAEINYTYVPTETNPLTVGPQPDPPTAERTLNKRVVYRIEPGQNCSKDTDPRCNVVLGSSQLKQKLDQPTSPVLVAVERRLLNIGPNHPAGSYYLVGIGNAGKELLSRLNYLQDPMTYASETMGQCNPTPLPQAFGSNVKNAEGNIVLESENGYRHSFPLTDLHQVESWAHFQQCYNWQRILFALYPSTRGKNDENVLLLLTTDPENPAGNERYYWRGYYPNPSPWWGWGFRFWW